MYAKGALGGVQQGMSLTLAVRLVVGVLAGEDLYSGVPTVRINATSIVMDAVGHVIIIVAESVPQVVTQTVRQLAWIAAYQIAQIVQGTECSNTIIKRRKA